MKNPKYLLILIFFVLFVYSTKATHIRAGEVIAKKVSSLTYQFTFIGYRDVDGVPFGQGLFDYGDGIFFGDDPDEQIPWEQIEELGNGVEKWQFTLVYTYSGASNYLVSYKEDFRNEDIQNISGSVNTPFYVETLLIIDPLIFNNTPFFTVPPIDQGVVGVVFEHNPGAFDPDGDSLSYYFKIPKQDEGLNVNGYRKLIDPAFYTNFTEGNQTKDGIPILSIDSITGTIVWDSPGGATIPDQESREFNVAFVVEEWRRINGTLIRLGYVTRDMQIIIWNYKNNPPELKVPRDTCVIAGNTVTGTIIGTDPDGDPVKIEAYGGPFGVSPPPSVSPDPAEFQPIPSILSFEWNTDCRLVRKLPYEIQFKATDKPTIPKIVDPSLGQVNFETFRIEIVGPPPKGLTASRQLGRKIQLNWNPYSCTNADSIQVWRRVGEFNIDPTCDPGIPENSAYKLIATLPISDTAFLDKNNGSGLSPGAKYCYRLVATFPPLGGGESIVSEEACESLLADVPIITNVDVKTTSKTEGKIIVKWTPPYQIDTLTFPPIYMYEVLRKEGQYPRDSFTLVRPLSTDTTFIDSGLNTKDISYSYMIILYDNTNQPVDTSQQASSVRLNPSPLIGGIQLNWKANVPWSNNVQKYPYHYLWRDHVTNDPNEIQLIDSIDVTINGFRYMDFGNFNGINLDEEIEYCYLVTTFGSYNNSLIPEPLINKSQIICAQPNDTVPPCMPVSIIFNSSFNCELQVACQTSTGNTSVELINAFSWSFNTSTFCDHDDIVFFKIYTSKNGKDGDFEFLEQTRSTEFFHNNLTTLAYCYYITAIDKSGNESMISEIVCNDNCPQYILPNVFTPNDDSTNETFKPIQTSNLCPRFVDKVLFKVFTRAGIEVYSFDSSEPENTIFIDWDGKSKVGKELRSGIYYYSAEVTFLKLNPKSSIEHIKGWVQIIR